MRKRIFMWLAGVLFSTFALFSQEIPAEVVTAFKKGNARELSPYLGNKVNLSVLNRVQDTDKKTAETTLATFFNQNKVTNFAVNHQGMRDESSFVIGTLTTSSGNYRVNCFFKRSSNGILIHRIRIDKVNE